MVGIVNTISYYSVRQKYTEKDGSVTVEYSQYYPHELTGTIEEKVQQIRKDLIAQGYTDVIVTHKLQEIKIPVNSWLG